MLYSSTLYSNNNWYKANHKWITLVSINYIDSEKHDKMSQFRMVIHFSLHNYHV